MGNKASYNLSSSILSSDKPVMDFSTSFDKPNLIPFIAVSMGFYTGQFQFLHLSLLQK